MNREGVIDIWVSYLCDEWLDRLGKPQFYPSVEPLIQKLRKDISNDKNFNSIWHCIEQTRKLYEQIPREGKISPRILLECGMAAYRMRNAAQAILSLSGAVSTYTDSHDKGVARWLLGCMYWYIGDSINGLSCWEEARRAFREQAIKIGRGTTLEVWYQDTIEEMEEAIKCAAKNEFPLLPDRSVKRTTGSKQHVLQFRSLPAIGRIPAGTPLSVLPTPMDFINVDRVSISDREYRIVSLIKGDKLVNIPTDDCFYLLRVSGNSMNRCSSEPIENGDYVLLRKQNSANPQDIVAAIILKGDGEDRQATLKRYEKRDGMVYLQPESDDPEFQKPIYTNRVFSKLDEELQIRGVAVAVLKPLSETVS